MHQRTKISVGDAWGSSLLDNLRQISSVVGKVGKCYLVGLSFVVYPSLQMLPQTSQQFLSQPEPTLSLLLESTVSEMVSEDLMLSNILTDEKLNALKVILETLQAGCLFSHGSVGISGRKS